MLSFITYKDAMQQIEIVADEEGINDLIQYLESIKKDKDHMHLIIDTELNAYPISSEMSKTVFYVKSVRLEYAKSEVWKNV